MQIKIRKDGGKLQKLLNYKKQISFVFALLGILVLYVGKNTFLLTPSAKEVSSAPLAFNIEIEPDQLNQLLAQQASSLERGSSLGWRLQDLPIKLWFQGKAYSADIRLHGKNPPHFRSSDKFSVRVHIRSTEKPLGLKEFSFIHPQARDNLYHFIYHEFVRRLGILSPRLEPVSLAINQKPFGAFILEEVIGDNLAERSGRVEGTTVFFKGSRVCPQGDTWPICAAMGNPSGKFATAVFVGEGKRKHNIPKEKIDLHEAAVKKLELFRRKKLKVADLFDIEKMANHMAAMVLFGASEFDYNDMAFFYDSQKEKFEPIAKHIHIKPRPGLWWLNEILDRNRDFVDLFLGDNEFLLVFLERLQKWKISPEFEIQIESVLTPFMGGSYANISSENTRGISLTQIKEELVSRATWLETELNPTNPIQAYLANDGRGASGLMIYNVQKIPIKVLGLKWVDKKGRVKYELQKVQPMLFWKNSVQEKRERSLFIPLSESDLIPKRLRLKIQVFGSSEIKEIEPYFWKNELDTEPHKEPESARFKPFPFPKEGKSIKLEGDVEIRESFYLPEGTRLIIESGANLLFKKGGSILAESPIMAFGTEEKPISIEVDAAPASGPLIEMRGKKNKSEFSFVQFFSKNKEGLRKARHPLIRVQQSNVKLSGCHFYQLSSSEILNLRQSSLEGHDLGFVNISGKILQADFSQVSFDSIDINQSQKEAITLRNSVAKMTRLKATHVDQAFLVAEKLSEVEIDELDIKDADQALVVSEGSFLRVDRFNLWNVKVGLRAVGGDWFSHPEEKKPFLPSRIIGSLGKFYETKRRFVVDQGSVISIDGSHTI